MPEQPSALEMAQRSARLMISLPESDKSDALMQAGLVTMRSWSLLSIAESLAIIATPPPICGDKWLAGPERVVACILPLGHLGDHRAADGTRLAS